MPVMDLTRIAQLILKENFLVLLGFPQENQKGYIPLRVVGREFYYFMYDPIQEGQLTGRLAAGSGSTGITDLGFSVPSRLSSSILTGKPFNVFLVKDNSRLYQLFYGIAPSACRTFLNVPANVGQRELEIDQWTSGRAEFGYIDGFESPLFSPSPNTELIVPPQLDFGIGYGNPLPVQMSPLLNFVVNHLDVVAVTDVDLVFKMLNGGVPVAIKTVGGLTAFTYAAEQYYGVKPMPLGADKSIVQISIGGTPGAQTPLAQRRGGRGPSVGPGVFG